MDESTESIAAMHSSAAGTFDGHLGTIGVLVPIVQADFSESTVVSGTIGESF
jgi:hypothetical protein